MNTDSILSENEERIRYIKLYLEQRGSAVGICTSSIFNKLVESWVSKTKDILWGIERLDKFICNCEEWETEEYSQTEMILELQSIIKLLEKGVN